MKIRPVDAVALGLLAVLAGFECWPMLAHLDTYGFHDWDVAAAHRQITVISLARYHQGPWWHP